MLAILAERIHDKRFLRLVGDMLRAGYLEDWTWHATYSGAPQGGILSPILSNIYLDRLDAFVAQDLVPAWTQCHFHYLDLDWLWCVGSGGSAWLAA